MGVLPVDVEVELRVPAEKVYRAITKGTDEVLPKLLPHAFKKFEIIQGDGGVGTIKQVTFGEEVPYTKAKLRIELIDEGNLSYSYRFIDGDVLTGEIESIGNVTKIIPRGVGCTMKQKITRYTSGNTPLTAEEIKETTDNGTMVAKAFESFILQNPNAY